MNWLIKSYICSINCPSDGNISLMRIKTRIIFVINTNKDRIYWYAYTHIENGIFIKQGSSSCFLCSLIAAPKIHTTDLCVEVKKWGRLECEKKRRIEEGEESWSFGSNTGEEGLFLWDSWGGEVYNKWQRGDLEKPRTVIEVCYYYLHFISIVSCHSKKLGFSTYAGS